MEHSHSHSHTEIGTSYSFTNEEALMLMSNGAVAREIEQESGSEFFTEEMARNAFPCTGSIHTSSIPYRNTIRTKDNVGSVIRSSATMGYIGR